jgi:molybdenum cofactor guanylyltransferase
LERLQDCAHGGHFGPNNGCTSVCYRKPQRSNLTRISINEGWKIGVFHVTITNMERQAFIVGAVLAGGAGSRMGGQKANQLLGGKALINWVVGALEGCSRIAVVGDPKAADQINAVTLTDPVGAPNGPLAGVLSALIWAKSLGAVFLVTVPCDTPFLPSDCAQRLVSAANFNSMSVACARSEAGLEPLVAAWRVDTVLPILDEALRVGRHPAVYALMGKLNAAFVDLTAHETTNVNTFASLHQAQAWLGSAQD